jgi:ABC-type phosphate transport system substrate-binding protein
MSYAGIVTAVAEDAGGIGYTSPDVATRDGAKTLTIGGKAADAATVNKGEYPYARVVRLYTNKMKESAAALVFVQFAQSARGQEVLAKAGFVPHP